MYVYSNTILFIRNNKGTAITSNGERLLEYANKILELIDKVNEEFLPSKATPSIKIGATQTLSASILPKLFSLFHEQNPETSSVLKTERQKVLVDMVVKGELDGAFVSGKITSKKVKELFTFKEALALVCSVPINGIDNLNAPIIVNSDTNCPYRKLLQKLMINNKYKPVSIIEFDSLESIINGITEGLGISLLPKSITHGNKNLYMYDLKGKFSKLEIGFIVNKDIQINSLINSFVEISNRHISTTRQ